MDTLPKFDSIEHDDLLHKRGVDVFGAEHKYLTWMDTNSIALGGVRPKDLLNTALGKSMIYDELGRIEHGIV
jgi:putative toxin-antitoxin system antitoxin component (TIGR02293 family)